MPGGEAPLWGGALELCPASPAELVFGIATRLKMWIYMVNLVIYSEFTRLTINNGFLV